MRNRQEVRGFWVLGWELMPLAFSSGLGGLAIGYRSRSTACFARLDPLYQYFHAPHAQTIAGGQANPLAGNGWPLLVYHTRRHRLQAGCVAEARAMDGMHGMVAMGWDGGWCSASKQIDWPVDRSIGQPLDRSAKRLGSSTE